jgi:hypothetical protein
MYVWQHQNYYHQSARGALVQHDDGSPHRGNSNVPFISHVFHAIHPGPTQLGRVSMEGEQMVTPHTGHRLGTFSLSRLCSSTSPPIVRPQPASQAGSRGRCPLEDGQFQFACHLTTTSNKITVMAMTSVSQSCVQH